MTEQATRTCQKCGQTKGLIEFKARRKTCAACETAAAAKRLERKDLVAFSDALAERIVDMLAAGATVAEVAEQSWGPTPRQLQAWRRGNVDFDAACQEAERLSAAAHLDLAKEALRQAKAGKLPVSDAKSLAETHLKLATTLNPARYGAHATVDVTSAGRPLVDFAAAISALIDALPTNSGALPAPEPLDVDATEVPEGRTLQ